MSDFNYQEYLRNNPLLKEEVKDQLITEGLNEDIYDDIVAADDDIPADQKKAAASAYRKVDKGASAEKALKNVKEEEVTEGNLDDLQKLMQNLSDALSAFKKKAEELKLDADSGDATQAVNYYIDDVFKANMERTGGQIDESAEITEEASSKMKVSELKAKIKEDIISLLQEEEDVEVDVEDEVEVDVEEPALDTPSEDAGLSQDEQEIQDSLKLAYDNAVAIGDQKLADQIGNSITFFTRTHVVER